MKSIRVPDVPQRCVPVGRWCVRIGVARRGHTRLGQVEVGVDVEDEPGLHGEVADDLHAAGRACRRRRDLQTVEQAQLDLGLAQADPDGGGEQRRQVDAELGRPRRQLGEEVGCAGSWSGR
jgi:hypothetical protein